MSTSASGTSEVPALSPDYRSWSNEQLIQRVTELERKLKRQTDSFPSKPAAEQAPALATSPKPKPKANRFDPSRYTTRHIALKFAYLGQNYNGYEHHLNNKTPLPTIEEELWRALVKTRLIFPKLARKGDSKGGEESRPIDYDVDENSEVNWEGCDYSKCGRTDRGVSAFGQVVGIRVRSNRPKPKEKAAISEEPAMEAQAGGAPAEPSKPPFDSIIDELPYVQMLNRVLPPDIRVLAWCPHPPADFSARFSCRERRYKYFFTQPAFSPSPNASTTYTTVAGKAAREGWLDIDAMREAASYLVGVHDFRNFCKIDATKQITNFERRIFHADIEEVSDLRMPSFLSREDLLPPGAPKDADPKLYTFVVHGSAFLWHQVRHLVAVLFLVGQGLERPTIVKELLDIHSLPAKPKYEMADDAPLVLWDCVFPAEGGNPREDSLQWIYAGDAVGGLEGNKKHSSSSDEKNKWGKGGIMEDIWQVWRKRKIDEVLAGALLDVVAAQPEAEAQATGVPDAPMRSRKAQRSTRLFDGGDTSRLQGKYIPVLEKPRMDPVEIINARWAERKGLNPQQTTAKRSEDDADE